ncbi:MAG: nicotinate-nucleotide adenylyltransferase [Pirellulales bacterium]|nr:nicotinate-nucleotide adenylyltransferase [Pirellulales bacterium]
MRLGVFGGTFDPVHYGHLLLAELCREAHRLDQVWFMPAATPPHKSGAPLTPAVRRVEMLELAIAGQPAFAVSELEIRRGGTSYTVETLAALHAEDPTRALFFLLGSDMLADLVHWREPARICQLATLVVAPRPGCEQPAFAALAGVLGAEACERIRAHAVCIPVVGISSSEIRRRAAAGLSIKYQTPPAVEQYILSHNLYR